MNEPDHHLHTQPDPPASAAANPRQRGKRLLTGILATTVVVLLALAAWMYLPVLQNLTSRTPTATQLPPSSTPTQTRTPSPSPTVTLTPTPSSTPMPPSAYQVPPDQYYPPVPGSALSAVVMNEDQSVTVEPSFDHPQWYSAEQISQQIGAVIGEPFYATIGSGSATWKMDVPLQPGLYELFVLDTVYSSGGSLDFQVFLGEREIFPILGIQHVQYSTLSGIPPQTEDQWRSIGVYDLDTIDLLSIQTRWEAREMSAIIAIDRVLAARRPVSIRDFIGLLPANAPKFVVDDSNAAIDSEAVWFTRNDGPAWGDEFQMVVNPEANSQITWQVPGRVPPGQYEVWVWVPEMEGSADILYKVLVNGQESQGALVASTGNMPTNQWVSLGTWQVQADPNIFTTEEGYIELGLRLDIPQGSMGEIAIDAVAFIFR